jgi:hypothetical protein
MMDDLKNKEQQIQAELSGEGVSRRGFMDRLKVLGVGFGAAFLMSAKSADAHVQDTVSLKSSNPALDAIIGGEKKQEAEGEKPVQEAWYRRFYRRFYHRWGGGYGYRRFYRRW